MGLPVVYSLMLSVLLHRLLGELYATVLHKHGVYKIGGVCFNAWDSRCRKMSRAGRGRHVAVAQVQTATTV